MSKVLVSAFRTRFSPRHRVQTDMSGESRTKQSFKEECDINVIMRRYEATGILPGALDASQMRYLDCTGADFQEAQLLVAGARTLFAELPARIRERFMNDPQRMLEFVENPKNREEAQQMGLVKPDAIPATPLAVEVVASRVRDPEQTSEPFALKESPPTGKVEAKPKSKS